MTRQRTQWAAIFCIIFAMLFFVMESAAFAGNVIYYKRDKKGTYHFTNRRKSTPDYSVYMSFKEIVKRYPNIPKKKLIMLAKAISKRYGMDGRLVQAVIEVESGFDMNAVSTAGAEGLMQIMPTTQQEVGVKNSFNPRDNIHGGVKYLKRMLARFGKVELALAAYNAGPGNVEKYSGIPPFKETQNYVKKVLARYGTLKAR